MITSLNKLYNEVAAVYVEQNKNRVIEEVEKELLDSTYIEVVDEELYLVSFLAENPIVLKDIDNQYLKDFILKLPLKLQKFVVFEKNNEELNVRWSISSSDKYLDLREQVIRTKENVEHGNLETAIILVEKGFIKDLDKYKKISNSVSIIEI